MSERKGGAHKTPRKAVHISEESHRLLADYAQSKGLKMSLIVEMFIEAGVEIDLYDPKWKERLRRLGYIE